MLILIYVILTVIAIAPFVAAIVGYRSDGELLDAVGAFIMTIAIILVTSMFMGFLGAIALSAWEYF